MVTRLRAAVLAVLLALCLIGSDLIPRVVAEDGTLMNLVGRVDSVTHALAVTSVSATGTDIPGALSGLVGATDSATRALKVYFDSTSGQVIGGNMTFSPDNTYDIGASAATRPRNAYVANSIFVGSTTKLSSLADGVLKLANNADSDFARLQFGGTTSSFPSLKRNGVEVQARLADDSSYANVRGGAVFVQSLRTNTSSVVLISETAPTISSGFGTSASIASNNGTAAFTVNVGTGGVATSGVVGLPTATTGWNCFVNDLTAAAAHVAYNTRQTASTTTSAALENQTTSTGAAVAWAASDILRVSCFAY